MTERAPGWKATLLGHMRPVMERVLARLQRDEAPPSVTLPASKTDFPKLLYLDMWVWVELSDAKSEVNDARDGAFLGQAITYGNVVVTEKQWASLANRTKIAERYGTRVIGRLSEIPAVLKQEDCI